MDSLWPWLAVAGLGALHGLNPASGWILAAAWGWRESDRARVWRALPSLALGHAASIAVVAFVFAQGVAMDQRLFPLMALALLAVAVLHCLRRGRISRPAGYAGLALWSFLVASAQGAGVMLVPALGPMCLGGGAARGIGVSGSLLLALSAVALHLAAMLLTTGAVASGVCRGLACRPTVLRRFRPMLLRQDLRSRSDAR